MKRGKVRERVTAHVHAGIDGSSHEPRLQNCRPRIRQSYLNWPRRWIQQVCVDFQLRCGRIFLETNVASDEADGSLFSSFRELRERHACFRNRAVCLSQASRSLTCRREPGRKREGTVVNTTPHPLKPSIMPRHTHMVAEYALELLASPASVIKGYLVSECYSGRTADNLLW